MVSLKYRKKVNWQTRLIYSERAQAFLFAAFFYTLAITGRNAERGMFPVHPFLKGHLNDVFSVPFWAGAYKFLHPSSSNKTLLVLAYLNPFIIELLQMFGVIKDGTFDPEDFVAYAVGIPIILALHYSAEKLYTSGITKPIYKALGIQDRRLRKTTIRKSTSI